MRFSTSVGAGGLFLLSSLAHAAPTFVEVKKISSAPQVDGAFFGHGVALRGAQLVSGAHRENAQGAIYLLRDDEGGMDVWGDVARMAASDAENGDEFGIVVDLFDTTIIVGTEYGDQAYIFEQDLGGPDAYGEAKILTVPGGGFAGRFGRAVAISGDRAFVGAPNQSGTATNGGAVYIFGRDEGGADNWGHIITLEGSSPEYQGRFGDRLTVDGNTLAVGGAGRTYVFEKDEGGVDNWGEIIRLEETDFVDVLDFGGPHRLRGDELLVWARVDDGMGVAEGVGLILSRNEGGANNWGRIGVLLPEVDQADLLGNMDFDGDLAIVGARNYGVNSGAVVVLERDSGGPGVWGQVQLLTASDRQSITYFGKSVALSGSRIVAGSNLGDGVSNAGSVYVFEPEEVGGTTGGTTSTDTGTGGTTDSTTTDASATATTTGVSNTATSTAATSGGATSGGATSDASATSSAGTGSDATGTDTSGAATDSADGCRCTSTPAPPRPALLVLLLLTRRRRES